MRGFKVEDMCFSYNGTPVFDNVSMNIQSGDITAFLGANGSGKTSMQRLLLRLLEPDSGSIILDGKPVQDYSIRELGRKIGWVPQLENPGFPYTVREYLQIGRAPSLGTFEAPGDKDDRVVDGVLKRLDLMTLTDRNINRMSGGERRLVLIARALVQEPEIVILDEPTSHLDLSNKSSILGLLRELKETGTTVIFSTHDPNEALRVADNVVLFSNGKIVASGDPEEVITEGLLRSIYEVDLRLLKVNDRIFVDFD